jgi:high-affinity nickel-transport protein
VIPGLSAGLPLSWPVLVVAGTGFLLGCRHGLDWDHITAIADLTAAGDNRRAGVAARPVRNLGLALWYCIGHGLVIVLLGVGVGVLGLNLPAGVDRVFESVVGATLIGLGGFVLWQLGRDRTHYRYTSRWRPVVGVVRRAWSRARRRGRAPQEALDDLGPRSALAIGVLHGTGAETPTQVVLFASAGAAGQAGGAALILLAFVAGLILSDLGIAAVWLTGLVGSRRTPHMQIALGVLTGVSSLAVGTLFVAGRSSVLPALFGG